MDTEQRDAADPEMQGVGGQRTRGKRLVIQPKKVDMQSLSDPAHYHCNTGPLYSRLKKKDKKPCVMIFRGCLVLGTFFKSLELFSI